LFSLFIVAEVITKLPEDSAPLAAVVGTLKVIAMARTADKSDFLESFNYSPCKFLATLIIQRTTDSVSGVILLEKLAKTGVSHLLAMIRAQYLPNLFVM
jgi:hypothetical protein